MYSVTQSITIAVALLTTQKLFRWCPLYGKEISNIKFHCGGKKMFSLLEHNMPLDSKQISKVLKFLEVMPLAGQVV